MKEFSFGGIGTKWQIIIKENISDHKTDEILLEIKNRIEEYEKIFSRFLPNSLITEISKKAGTYIMPDEAEEILVLYRELYDLTDGAVTPLIGNTISDTGYDAVYSLVSKENISKPKAWDEVLDYQHPKLIVKEPVLLDFGALGKGQMIDIVAGILKDYRIENFMINAGGDILYQNNSYKKGIFKNKKYPNKNQIDEEKYLRVGLENPEDFSQVIGIAKIFNQSLCSSAGSRRKWGEYTHIIDANTLKSPKDIVATWVIAPKTILADGLATALFFTPVETLLKKYTFDYVVMFSDHSIKYSPFFNGELFMK